MKVVIDTTVFGQGFHSRSADVRLLRNFLERTGAELYLPAIVIEEAANLVRKSMEEANTKLGAVRRLTGDESRYGKLELEGALKIYPESLDALLKSMKAQILPYPSVSHPKLVERALIPNKPFVASGRGYRDTLIWFSILELARNCTTEISFISGNTDDWCQSRNELKLHGDLLKDLDAEGIDTSRFRMFDSLGDFIQRCAVMTLQVASPSMKDAEREPDYLPLLIDGEDWIKTILPQRVAEFLRGFSRADAPVEDVVVLALSSPAQVRASPVRIIDEDRRLLEFSAKYRIALQFLIRKSDLAVWSQRLSMHLRQDWDESHLRVQATMGITALFRMIQRGENTEDFSVVSVSSDYFGEFHGLDPVAVKLRQTEVHAPEHTTWGTVKCESCGEEFAVGCHRLHPANSEKECVAKLEGILESDHRAGRPHESLYDLGPRS
jgi:predicted nucleic acid-binding protein